MSGMKDYVKLQDLERSIVNELVARGEYLMSIRQEMVKDLKELDAKIDEIAKEMRAAGINVEIDDIWE